MTWVGMSYLMVERKIGPTPANSRERFGRKEQALLHCDSSVDLYLCPLPSTHEQAGSS